MWLARTERHLDATCAAAFALCLFFAGLSLFLWPGGRSCSRSDRHSYRALSDVDSHYDVDHGFPVLDTIFPDLQQLALRVSSWVIGIRHGIVARLAARLANVAAIPSCNGSFLF